MTQVVNQTVLVTGANRGIGREFVRQLLDRGVAKVYAAARDPQMIVADDPRLVPLHLDVTDAGSVTRAAEIAQDVSVVVNNAGIARGASVLDPDTATPRSELGTNLFGPLAVTSAFADRLAQRSGVVINIASVTSWLPVGTYGVSKAALWSATDSMRLELAPRGVQVVGVHVGYVDTDMSAGIDAAKSDPADVVRQVLDGVERETWRSWPTSSPARSVPACTSRSKPDSPRSSHRARTAGVCPTGRETVPSVRPAPAACTGHGTGPAAQGERRKHRALRRAASPKGQASVHP